jgi:putative oxidoreductase
VTYKGKGMKTKLFKGEAQHYIIFVRLIVGAVFLSEGIQKFLFPDAQGIGRFIRIGIPAPEIMAPFVGAVEVICGLLVILGLFTQLASIPLIIDMLVAMFSTKIPILIEKGFWSMAHEARTDWSMLFGALFLLMAGSGKWSLDNYRAQKIKGSI